MKRTFFVLAALFCMVFSVSGQNSGPVDLILVLDTSSSMSGSYREVNDYLTGPFLREFLRIGDTFHLVPFAGEAFVDVSRRVEGQGDVQTILSRIFLAYPMGPESDVEGALSFAEQYASTLPASRGKKIVLVTDGGNVPSLTSLADAAKRRLEPRGVSLDLVPVPLAALPSSNRPGARSPETRTAAAGRAAAPSVPSAPSAPVAPLARTEVRPDGVDAPAGPSPSPAAESPGAAGVSGAPGGEGAPSAERGADPSAGKAEDAAPDSPAAPYGSPVTETAAPADRRGFTFPAFSLDMFPYIAGLVILVLLILGLILFIAGRDLHGSPNRAISRAASARPSRPAEPPPPREPQPSQPAAGGSADLLTSYAASQRPRVSPYAHRYKPQPVEYEGPLMLNLFVEDQNTAIGKRNIHAVKQGYTFTVGGGKSDFLIFLVPVPPHIGEIRCDGNNCTFIPKKPNYFPDTGSQQIPDCIGKMVRVVSDKNYELHFRMERYEDPLRALNRLLRSVSVPG
ncbi:MAG: VWA domain-containing protein [Treponema sp.]|jgi:hypothetical protein|nr:VWA domain-containing protein [Treponema sp.]